MTNRLAELIWSIQQQSGLFNDWSYVAADILGTRNATLRMSGLETGSEPRDS